MKEAKLFEEAPLFHVLKQHWDLKKKKKKLEACTAGSWCGGENHGHEE